MAGVGSTSLVVTPRVLCRVTLKPSCVALGNLPEDGKQSRIKTKNPEASVSPPLPPNQKEAAKEFCGTHKAQRRRHLGIWASGDRCKGDQDCCGKEGWPVTWHLLLSSWSKVPYFLFSTFASPVYRLCLQAEDARQHMASCVQGLFSWLNPPYKTPSQTLKAVYSSAIAPSTPSLFTVYTLRWDGEL